ncbi:DUF7504 family protein [Haloarcula litorea]|uniref:DUF7504 family protein n=1 Tax=Haloarcula litorea TaxID=3032579 RepID=UPI0023E83F6B|nr:hypothetical protein [Halomicroarcula sp. GDY20]
MTDNRSGVTNHISEAESVLLLAPSETAPDNRACIDFLTQSPPDETNVLSVTLEMTPDQRLGVWQQAVGETLPHQTTILDARPGTDASVGTDTVTSVPELELDVLRPSAGVTDLGLTIARILGAWSETPRPTQVCLHSVTELLARFDERDVVELIAGLNDLQNDLDVCAHHHLDPTACEDSVLPTLRPLYDAVLEHDGEGWIVSEATDTDVSPSFRRTTPPPGGTSVVTAERPETIPMPYSFDGVLDLLSDPIRRTILYYLKDRDRGEISLETVIDDVHRRATAVPARDPPARTVLETSCHHNHFPMLAEAGVIRLDREGGTLWYEPNEALESCLRYVETLELG